MLNKEKSIVFLKLLQECLIFPKPPKKALVWTEFTKIALDFLEENNEIFMKEALEYLYKNNKIPLQWLRYNGKKIYCYYFYSDNGDPFRPKKKHYIEKKFTKGCNRKFYPNDYVYNHIDPVWLFIVTYDYDKKVEILMQSHQNVPLYANSITN